VLCQLRLVRLGKGTRVGRGTWRRGFGDEYIRTMLFSHDTVSTQCRRQSEFQHASDPCEMTPKMDPTTATTTARSRNDGNLSRRTPVENKDPDPVMSRCDEAGYDV
jgi:hypothetical protein